MKKLTSFNPSPVLPRKAPPPNHPLQPTRGTTLKRIAREQGIVIQPAAREPIIPEDNRRRVIAFHTRPKSPLRKRKYQRIDAMKTKKALLGEKGMKTCTHCHKSLPYPAFDLLHDKKHRKWYRRSYCFLCRQDMNRVYYLTRSANDTTTIL